MNVRLTDVAASLPIKTGHLFIGLALLMAIISAMVITNMASNKGAHKKADFAVKKIMVANTYIPHGATITPADIKLVDWPEPYLPVGSVFTSPKGLLGRVVRSEFLPGEPLYKEKLSGDKSTGGLPVIIPAGMRAITTRVSEIKAVAGFVRPGDRVDVLVTLNHPQEPDKKVTKTVLQNVLVIAASQQMISPNENTTQSPAGLAVLPEKEGKDKNKDKKKEKEKSDKELEKEKKDREKKRQENEKRAKNISSVTFALAPEDSEKLALAEDIGELKLVLRAEGDETAVETQGATSEDLMTSLGVNTLPKLQLPPAPPFPPAMVVPAKKGKQVEFIEGTEKTSLDF